MRSRLESRLKRHGFTEQLDGQAVNVINQLVQGLDGKIFLNRRNSPLHPLDIIILTDVQDADDEVVLSYYQHSIFQDVKTRLSGLYPDDSVEDSFPLKQGLFNRSVGIPLDDEARQLVNYFFGSGDSMFVSGLNNGHSQVLNDFWISSIEQKSKGLFPFPWQYGQPFNASEYLKHSPPTLAQLVYAFFYKNPDSSFVSPELREDILKKGGSAEFTSTFVMDGQYLIQGADSLAVIEGRLSVFGGIRREIKMPPPGWCLEYDFETGLPAKTTPNKSESQEFFGDDASYVNLSPKPGLYVVVRFGFRGPLLSDTDKYFGPFGLHMVSPLYGSTKDQFRIGSRSVS